MVSFSQLPAVKKDTIFGAASKLFGPSYFVTALIKITIQVLYICVSSWLLADKSRVLSQAEKKITVVKGVLVKHEQKK